MSDDTAPPPMALAWVVEEAWEIDGAQRDLPEGSPALGVVNEGAVWDERRAQWKERGTGNTSIGGFRYGHFATTPRYVAPSSFAPDWVEDNGLRLVSPRLLALLDQPRGSLQALPTETEWLGPDAPGFSYLWLAYVPFAPALDLDRCEGKLEWIMRGGEQVQVLGLFGGGRLRLRADFTPPCGLFLAAEGTRLLMATDAVAEAVLRAGCTGIEFRHPEAAVSSGTWFRRGLDGVKLHPRDVAFLEAQANPAPDVPPDINLPPLGSPLHWDRSPLDLVDWEAADTELRAYMVEGSDKDHAVLLTLLLDSISDYEDTLEELLNAIADVRAGRVECWTRDFSGDLVVTVRPDAAWVWDEHAYPGKQLRAFPLDGMDTVLRRWAEAVQHYCESQKA